MKLVSPQLRTSTSIRPYEPLTATLSLPTTEYCGNTLDWLRASMPSSSPAVETSRSPLFGSAARPAPSQATSKLPKNAFRPWIRAFLWTNIPFQIDNSQVPIAATHTSQPSACEWNSLELLFCGISNTGDLLFEALLFVPAGTWEATAFIAASDAVSAPRAWVSSFGENALITSSWADVPCSVGLARSLPAFSSFQFEPVSSSPSSLLGPVPTPSIIRPRLSQMCAAPWVAARPGEARVCAVLTRACSLVHTLPEFRLSSEALSSNIACSYIAIMAAAILVEHLSGSVELHGVLSVALLITTVLRDHSTANKTRILTLCTGFTGEKIAVIMRGLDSHARSILACSSLPVLPAVTEVDPEHALLSLTHWAFDVVPSLVPAAGPSGSLLSQLALDLADVSIDSYKQLRVMPRVVDMLVHQLLLPANCSAKSSVHNLYISTILVKLLTCKDTSPSPTSVRDVIGASTHPSSDPSSSILRRAFAASVCSRLQEVVLHEVWRRRGDVRSETDTSVDMALPIDCLMKLLVRVHKDNNVIWSAQRRVDIGSARASTPPAARMLPHPSPPHIGCKTHAPSFDADLRPQPLEHAVDAIMFHPAFMLASADAPSLCIDAPSASMLSVSVSRTDTITAEALEDMWQPIMASLARLLTHVSPIYRDGSVRDEYYTVVSAVQQLCVWPTLLAECLHHLAKSWPWRSSGIHASVLVDMVQCVLDAYNKDSGTRPTEDTDLIKAIARIAHIILRCCETGTVELSKQCLAVFTALNTTSISAPMSTGSCGAMKLTSAAVKPSASSALLTALSRSGAHLDIKPRLVQIQLHHWNAVIREAASVAIASLPDASPGPLTPMLPSEKRKYPPLPPSPQSPQLGTRTMPAMPTWNFAL